jgi:carbonic anhydrase
MPLYSMKLTCKKAMWFPVDFSPMLLIGVALLVGVISAASFSYDQTNTQYGPSAWSTLAGSSACSNAARGSPVDLKVSNDAQASTARMTKLDVKTYETVARTIGVVNDGATVSFTFGADKRYSYILDPTNTASATRYQLQMIRFHSPSEHTISGAHFDGELQIHYTASSDFPRSSGDVAAVVVVLPVQSTTVGSNTEIQKLFDMAAVFPTNTPLSATSNTTLLSQEPFNNPGAFRVPNLIPSSGRYVTYDGSLSNPPCTANYRYVVFTQTTRMELRMFAYLRNRLGYSVSSSSAGALLGNYRPLQASSATQRFYADVSDPTQFEIYSTGSGSSTAARTYAIASLVITGVSFLAIALAVAGIASMISRVENAVTEMAEPTTATASKEPQPGKSPVPSVSSPTPVVKSLNATDASPAPPIAKAH